MARKGHRQTKDIYNFGKGSGDFTPRDAVKTAVTLTALGITADIAKSIVKK